MPKNLYIKRRGQLLRETTKVKTDRSSARDERYLYIRSQLLQLRYGVSVESLSMRSRPLSSLSRPSSLPALESPATESPAWGKVDMRGMRVVPTNQARASRAIAGNTSIGEHYAFAGMHHIFDQVCLTYGMILMSSVVFIQSEDKTKIMTDGSPIFLRNNSFLVFAVFQHASSAVTTVKFANNDRSLLGCSSLDGCVSICSMFPEPRVIFILKGHSQGAPDFDWSSTNDLIVSCSLDQSMRLWDANTGNCLRTVFSPTQAQYLSCLFQPSNNNFVVVLLLFCPDCIIDNWLDVDRLKICVEQLGSSKGEIQVVNVSTGIFPRGGSIHVLGGSGGGGGGGGHPPKILSLAFDPPGNVLWAADDKGCVTSLLFQGMTGHLTRGHRLTIFENTPITSLECRTWLSREAPDPTLLVNCASNRLCAFRVEGKDGSLKFRRVFPVKHTKYCVKSTFCPIMSFRQGIAIVSGSEDGVIYFFDLEREQKSCFNTLQGHSSPVLDVAFNYDESLLASSDASGLVIVWKK
ncbi:unnamed protein product [Darwinula stevensoni]|uniref:WD repeat domain 13 n=1 Tax=Darwinula stevensoni TaxID=69355 RepID=A0A7R9A404_9CRUS|nr:unnamed protein product [Darwinula stevensoni]CAG0892667.1 unnamed protein product [Darwinula stevensoni]